MDDTQYFMSFGCILGFRQFQFSIAFHFECHQGHRLQKKNHVTLSTVSENALVKFQQTGMMIKNKILSEN